MCHEKFEKLRLEEDGKSFNKFDSLRAKYFEKKNKLKKFILFYFILKQ